MRLKLITLAAAGLLLNGCGFMGGGDPVMYEGSSSKMHHHEGTTAQTGSATGEMEKSRAPRSYYYKKQ